jgi:hypothetical protein
MEHVKAFTPKPSGATVNITPTTTSSNIAMNEIQVNNVSRGNMRIYNNTGSVVFIKFGPDNTVAATVASDIPIAAGEVEVFGVRPDVTYVAAILASGTATGAIYFSPGEGI